MEDNILNLCLSYGLNAASAGKFSILEVYKKENLILSDDLIQYHLNIIKKLEKLFIVRELEIEIKVQVSFC
jgi:hypothetical protein